ncbi:MAG: inorganic phosphate transporter [Bacteroidales bacterium]|nr:inorganic phosphate transporter [Bacteroidales bacterium]
MENVYLIMVIVLFFLAISDLIVGVSNDAVNFLNSAIGSKAAPFKVIMTIAALGILVGATFSSGMMEVARKGIFHPEHFFFSEIMIIFLAVMITDVILLDMFNTFGLPTSTTVSIVFELLGAAVGISIIKVSNLPEGSDLSMGELINSGNALLIIAGILLSVVVAFSAGAIIQYISRLIFSFDYKKNLKRFGAIWGGIAISAITYFILIKGAKGASFMDVETITLIKENTWLILGISFFSWTILLQVLSWLVKLNILKMIVLVGTFALAMAFAGNDLVNFIGVPLAGYESFKNFLANPEADPNLLSMAVLAGKVKTPTFFLLIAGLIMVITLWFSKKSRNVVKTTLDLSRQDEGSERFGSSFLSRSLVRSSINFSKIFKFIVPKSIKSFVAKQFDQSVLKKEQSDKDAPSFDLIRASVTLVVASMLIAFGTSLKLPLSTTYVTFMVAMGTSLSDKAWGRESAVYRITGVLSVIGGWFFTAFSAFTLAFIMALLFYWGGIYAIGSLVIIALFIVIHSYTIHKKREKTSNEVSNDIGDEVNGENILFKCSNTVTKTLNTVNNILINTISGLSREDLKLLRNSSKDIKNLNKKVKYMKDTINKTIIGLQEDSIETGHYYVQVLDYLREIAHDVTFITIPVFKHIDNNHKGLIPSQLEELNNIISEISKFFKIIERTIAENNYSNVDRNIELQHKVLSTLDVYRKNQIKRIKREEVGTKNSMLYFNIINEIKNLLLHTINLLKAQRDFVKYNSSENNND